MKIACRRFMQGKLLNVFVSDKDYLSIAPYQKNFGYPLYEELKEEGKIIKEE